MTIKTIGDLKRELQKIQTECGFNDDTLLYVPVQSSTQAHPAGAFKVSFVQGGYGGLGLFVGLPEGFSISERKRK